MDVPFVATIALTVASFLAVALMAFFALRPEKAGPKCPRCDKRVRDDMTRCPQCGLVLGESHDPAATAGDRALRP
ncbi:MAG: hypothetical protein KGK34_02375 [Chloroflexota bacterium]|nr:hypothetical protein [Chloroflexota bacterium]